MDETLTASLPIEIAVDLLQPSSVDGESKFQIQVNYNGAIQWKIVRSFQQIKVLVTQFQVDFPNSPLASFRLDQFPDTKAVEALLKLAFQTVHTKFWNYDHFLVFLDEQINQSPMSKMYFGYMDSQMTSLQQKLSLFENRLLSIESSAFAMHDLLLKFTQQQTSPRAVDQSPRTAPQSFSTLSSGGYQISSLAQGTGSFNDISNVEVVAAPTFQSPPKSVPSPKSESSSDSSLSSVSEASLSEQRWNQGSPSGTKSAGDGLVSVADVTTTTGDVTTAVVKINSAIPDEWSVPFTGVIDELLTGLLPHENQVQYRLSALALLKRQVRAVLGVISYEVGFFAIRSFLSDDPIKLTLIVNPTQLAWWYNTLAEKLKLIAENPVEMQRFLNDTANNSDLTNHEELRIIANHNLRNISCISDKTPCKILCAIDSLDIEITANNRSELCLLAFFEEISTIVGQNDLFKRSTILIRAWWQYETPTIIGSDIRHYLSEFILGIMITSIFNQYHTQIQHPFQALLCFLREYSQLEVTSHAISLQGIVGFEPEATNQPKLMFPSSNHIINAEMLERYWKMFNLNDALNTEPPSGVPKPQLDIATRYEMLRNSMLRSIQKFDKRGLNIIHPFLNTNMITEKFSNRRLTSLSKAFKVGYANLTDLLQQIHAGKVQIQDLTTNYFSNTYKKVNTPWRADAVNNVIPEPGSDPSWSASKALSLDNGYAKMLQNIQYCNFIADAILSESAIITFCIDLLVLRGSLPVGEIGKILSEASSVQNLSHRLREKYGGLKKFLERYPELFIFSNDHPFNPHILLRQTISAENLELIDRGIFPLHLLSKAAKTQANLPRKPPAKAVDNPISPVGSLTSYSATSARIGPTPSSYGNNVPAAGVPSSYAAQGAGRFPPQPPAAGRAGIPPGMSASSMYDYPPPQGSSPRADTYGNNAGISTYERSAPPTNASRFNSTYAPQREMMSPSSRYNQAGLASSGNVGIGAGPRFGGNEISFNEYDYRSASVNGAGNGYRGNEPNSYSMNAPRGLQGRETSAMYGERERSSSSVAYTSTSTDFYSSEGSTTMNFSSYGDRGAGEASNYLGNTNAGMLSSSGSVIGSASSRYDNNSSAGLFGSNSSRIIGNSSSHNNSNNSLLGGFGGNQMKDDELLGGNYQQLHHHQQQPPSQKSTINNGFDNSNNNNNNSFSSYYTSGKGVDSNNYSQF
eukprot:CAMPEP_0173137304 /NCGR_PEP_ID=MMETSP1105-20130129/3004_1 /TAXON_ID=2985 /ORGANISM="Ochromonas sp., Strain BG-1" /LENGTH=1201 /DNA_ID=CAMNT_0014049661 /DNA_START=34 /DNA_END=3639 /DNA_ORIENTATION=+